ncbi:TonB-dependent siderophore receptor [Erwiniaceae bacterium BAC15a-03b]|uniref:TonB-dependent siderophore receptor n=1 Tax=Winslowiella arboricola TaxID=2978220 RepID=A0A9J6PZ91_9GAMM|nr:TonB-dependent siderophore receptor [Winslowiella arboricola]MCU5775367.1 TonB-dependent siderophore receptor [Winslowiella arboricola]MCU5780236.1 TonB-dependent siderophore receptor [Winslowiella arboricola]
MHSTLSATRGFKPTLLAVLIGSVTFPTLAATSTDTDNSKKNESTMTVVAAPEDNFKAGGDELVPAYLDGQVINGGRMGMLGQQNAMDVPFNVIGFSSKLIEDQQAKTIADVVRNDAAVQNVQGYGNYGESYRIRGFQLDGDDMTLGGLAGIMPRQVISTAMVDRVEVFKGANALMNGAATSAVGGMINLEPKHAGDLPLARVGIDYTSSSQIGTSVDAGRRFGDDDQFGVRVNLLQREGETAVDDEKRRTTVASIGLDYRQDNLRTSLDMGYQKQTFHGGRIGVKVSDADFIPNAPSATHNTSQKWVYSDLESQFAMLRGEYDVAQDWTLYGGVGLQHSHESGAYGSPSVTSTDGSATMSRMDVTNIKDSYSGMFGLRGAFDTAFVSHKVNVGYSATTSRSKAAYDMALTGVPTNIYDTPDITSPTLNFAGGDMDEPGVRGRTRTQGILLTDTLGVLDDKVELTLGTRYQKVVTREYDYNTGAEVSDSSFEDSRWTPAVGLMVKPWEHISLYANHIESLQPGSSAPVGTANYGESTGVLHSKQNEVGVKVDYQRVGGSLALFEIKQPSAVTNASNIYALDGEQRNRGIELNLFGEPVLGLRLNGSATWIDAQLTKTANGANDGNTAVGVPSYNMVLGAEYDIQPVDGLTATALVNHNGAQYANAANTKKLDGYTTLDLGVRYTTKVQDNDMVWRVGVDNVTNKSYWSNVDSSGTYIYQGAPRTLKVSMSYDF